MTKLLTLATSVPDTPRESQSYWARIANELAEAIARGVYEPGQRLPSEHVLAEQYGCLLYTSPSPRDKRQSRMPSSA